MHKRGITYPGVVMEEGSPSENRATGKLMLRPESKLGSSWETETKIVDRDGMDNRLRVKHRRAMWGKEFV